MEIKQGTPEWLQLRIGKITASRIADILSQSKKGETATRAKYRNELIRQRMTGVLGEFYTNSHMQRGIELEPLARASYEVHRGLLVDQVAFVNHPTILSAGASPDGLIGSDGLIEIKCPTPDNHIENLINDEAPKKYFPQMQWQMACTGRKWCDFVSFDPDANEHIRLFVKRVYRDDDWIKGAEQAVIEFDKEVDAGVRKLHSIKFE
jgi:putative phage-type endonuclease